MWIKNTNGKKDSMLTFATVAFFVVIFNIILATFGGVTVGEFNINFQPMDSGAMGVFLGATFTAYVSRRATDVAAGAYVKGKEVSKKDSEKVERQDV